MKGNRKLDQVRNRRSRGVVVTAMLAATARYCWSARSDERNGYPCTAALRWRKAAEIAPFPAIADQCWREWERIMCLPRAFAEPIGDCVETRANAASVPLQMCA